MTITSNIWGWSTTAADNDDVDSTINWAEGMDPGAVNNSGRAMMAATKRLANVLSGNVTVGGTANAITITTGQSIESAQQALGFRFAFKATGTNTGATTINVDTNGAVAVKRVNGDALSAGDIVSGGIYDVAHNGTNYTLVGAGAGTGTYSTLSGDNTFTGTNIFQGATTIGDGSGDTVVIKGTTVNSYMSGLLSTSSKANLQAALDLGTAAYKNTGTSGDAVPLLNQDQTFSGTQYITTSGSSVGQFQLHHTAMSIGNAWQTFLATVSGLGTGVAGNITLGASGASYNGTSDARLKTDIRPMGEEEVYALVMGLAPVHYRWKSTGIPDFGYLAQDSYDLNPLLATPGHGEPGDEDFRPWMMEKGREGPWLAAAIRFMLKRLDALEAR